MYVVLTYLPLVARLCGGQKESCPLDFAISKRGRKCGKERLREHYIVRLNQAVPSISTTYVRVRI